MRRNPAGWSTRIGAILQVPVPVPVRVLVPDAAGTVAGWMAPGGNRRDRP